jgi:winged helix DNA-binding protein
LMRAELDEVVCSRAPRGKQQTYAAFNQRVPQAKPVDRDEALVELMKRYFKSRGPATLKDFLRWSSLTASDGKAGLEVVGPQLEREVVNGRTYWSGGSQRGRRPSAPRVDLVQGYDECIMGGSVERNPGRSTRPPIASAVSRRARHSGVGPHHCCATLTKERPRPPGRSRDSRSPMDPRNARASQPRVPTGTASLGGRALPRTARCVARAIRSRVAQPRIRTTAYGRSSPDRAHRPWAAGMMERTSPRRGGGGGQPDPRRLPQRNPVPDGQGRGHASGFRESGPRRRVPVNCHLQTDDCEG